MSMADRYTQILTNEDFQAHSQQIMDEFSKKNLIYPSLDIQLVRHATRESYDTDRIRMSAGPVYTQKMGDAFTIHICQELLSGITRIALQGWLEHEMTLCTLLRYPEYYECNFRTKIFPLMPVTGSAESFMREIVMCLEDGLRHYLTTKTLLILNHGCPQVHFYLFKLAPNPEDPIKYRTAECFLWVRALMLCGRLKDFMPIYLLAKKQVDMSRELYDFWRQAHDYLPQKDREVIKNLGELPDGQDGMQYSEMVVDMFKLIKEQYLHTSKKKKPQTSIQ